MKPDRPLRGDAVYILTGTGQKVLCWVWYSWPTKTDRFQTVEGGFFAQAIQKVADLIAYRNPGLRRGFPGAPRRWFARRRIGPRDKELHFNLCDEDKTWERTDLRGAGLETFVRLSATADRTGPT